MKHFVTFISTITVAVAYFGIVFCYWFKKADESKGDAMVATWITFILTVCVAGFAYVVWELT